MLTKHTPRKNEFGFWHGLYTNEGIARTVAQAKKNGDWLILNLYRRDTACAAELLFGSSENDEWTVKTEREEVFRFGKDKFGYVTVEFFSPLDELTDAKLYTAGVRFLSGFADAARTLEFTHPKVFQRISAYPADIYRRPGSVSEDVAPLEEFAGEAEPVEMPVGQRKRQR